MQTLQDKASRRRGPDPTARDSRYLRCGNSAGRPAGLTLVELVAATLLAALLLTALVGVLQSMARQRKGVDDASHGGAWRASLQERLRWDLSNARQMHVRPSVLTLVGYGARDFETHAATHRPAEVTYFVRRVGGRPWLLRRERHLDEPANRSSRVELLCSGVARIHVSRLEDDPRNPVTPVGDALYPIPTRVRCTLSTPNGRPLVQFALIQHREGR